MNTQQARKKWIAVLRDPASEKACYLLADNPYSNSRCCLGHACHAVGIGLETIDDCYKPTLPDEVARLLDITPSGELRAAITVGGDAIETLIGLNDRTDMTPATIADIIECEFARNNFAAYGEDTNG